MSDAKNIEEDLMLVDVIKMLSSIGETGRLKITANATTGAFSFKDGKLIDAQLGTLAGFQAINAAVSLQNVHFSFDPSITPPANSSFRPNERVVLKRFFGIETVDAHDLDAASTSDVNWDLTPSQVVPLTEVAEFSDSKAEETATIEVEPVSCSISDQAATLDEFAHSNAEGMQFIEESSFSADESEPDYAYPGLVSSVSRHRVGLYVIVLLLVTAAATFALVRKMNQLRRATLMAQSSYSAPTAPPQQVNNQAPVSVVVPKQQSEYSPSVVNGELRNKQAATDSRSLPVTEQQRAQLEPESSSAHNLTGEWKLVNTVEKTRYRSFDNLEIGFRLVINQTGKEFTAKGEKISENGRILPLGNRTPIHMTGVIEGDKVLATFFEHGTVRKTNGRFVWRIQNSGAGLRGTFASTAARSQGTSAATKEL